MVKVTQPDFDRFLKEVFDRCPFIIEIPGTSSELTGDVAGNRLIA